LYTPLKSTEINLTNLLSLSPTSNAIIEEVCEYNDKVVSFYVLNNLTFLLFSIKIKSLSRILPKDKK
jgi:hypothetical protein